MEIQAVQAQNESETTPKVATNENQKKSSSSKKPIRGTKQIYSKVQGQIEFYFSPSNLTKDRFMAKLIQEDSCEYKDNI